MKNTAQGINAQCAITPRPSLARELTAVVAVLLESVHEVRVTVDEDQAEMAPPYCIHITRPIHIPQPSTTHRFRSSSCTKQSQATAGRIVSHQSHAIHVSTLNTNTKPPKQTTPAHLHPAAGTASAASRRSTDGEGGRMDGQASSMQVRALIG